jgi:hypothetical protein
MIITPGALPTALHSQLLFVLRGANMQSVTDQAFTKVFAGTKYKVQEAFAVCKSGGATVACAGGIYDAASKGGNALVASSQSWLALASTIPVAPALTGVSTAKILSPALFLSLTTGSTAAVTADVFVFGYIVD